MQPQLVWSAADHPDEGHHCVANKGNQSHPTCVLINLPLTKSQFIVNGEYGVLHDDLPRLLSTENLRALSSSNDVICKPDRDGNNRVGIKQLVEGGYLSDRLYELTSKQPNDNFVPSFELCNELKLAPAGILDVAVRDANSVEFARISNAWIIINRKSSLEDNPICNINVLREYIHGYFDNIYVISTEWILEQNISKPRDQLYELVIKNSKSLTEYMDCDSSDDELEVSFAQKDYAKSLGAKWNGISKVWYVPTRCKEVNKYKLRTMFKHARCSCLNDCHGCGGYGFVKGYPCWFCKGDTI